MRVLNKTDLLPERRQTDESWLRLSLKTGEGLAELVRALEAEASRRIGTTEAPVITHARHRRQLEACLESLTAYLDGPPAHIELRAEDLRQAASALGRITGRVDPEDVLDQIFARFCIGK